MGTTDCQCSHLPDPESNIPDELAQKGVEMFGQQKTLAENRDTVVVIPTHVVGSVGNDDWGRRIHSLDTEYPNSSIETLLSNGMILQYVSRAQCCFVRTSVLLSTNANSSESHLS